MQNKKNKIIIVIIISIIIFTGIIYFKVLNNNQNLKENIEISNVQFDENENITHYKCSVYIQGYDKDFGNEYNFSYVYDEKQRITKAFYDEKNYIDIEYDNANHISKLIDMNKGIKYEYNFEYDDDKTNIIKKYKTSLLPFDGATLQQESEVVYKGYLKNFKYNGREYILYREMDERVNTITSEIVCEKREENINYSNLRSILNITYPYYKNIDNVFSNDFFSEIIPIFSAGKVIYIDSLVNISEKNNELDKEGAMSEIKKHIKENNI